MMKLTTLVFLLVPTSIYAQNFLGQPEWRDQEHQQQQYQQQLDQQHLEMRRMQSDMQRMQSDTLRTHDYEYNR